MSLEHIHQVKALIPRDRLRELMVRSDRHAWCYLALHMACLLASGGLVYLSMDTWLLIPAMGLLGILIVHLFSPQHEFAHRTAFRTRWLNDLFGWLFGLIIMLPNVYFRWEHTAHHSYTQNEKRDPQLIALPKNLAEYLFYLSSIPYWWGFLTSFSRHVLGTFSIQERRFIPRTEKSKVVLEARAMLAIYASIGLFVVFTNRTEPLYFWFFPRMLAEPWMRFVRMTEHVGRAVNDVDLLKNTRTTVAGRLARFIAWNMPFHAEHHVSPAVPFHALPAFHEQIRKNHADISIGYLDAHRAILRNVFRQNGKTADC